MPTLESLFGRNRDWAARMERDNPGFFQRLAAQQNPDYLWIGCSDSRVPANEIIGLLPGEVFVHRNVANVVVHTDLNCLSVVQYAVDVLGVDHIIVCGHYGCGGIRGALDGQKHGLIDNWLRHVQDIQKKHDALLAGRDLDTAVDMLCELNVIEQAINICQTTVIQDAWDRGQVLNVHGWIYKLHDGRLRNMRVSLCNNDALAEAYAGAMAQFHDRHGI